MIYKKIKSAIMLYLIPVIVLLEFTIAVKVRAQSQMPVSTAGKFESKERNAVIDTLVKKVNDYYVFPEVAQKMADVIRQRQKHHDYDTVTNREVFAKMLQTRTRAPHPKKWSINSRKPGRYPISILKRWNTWMGMSVSCNWIPFFRLTGSRTSLPGRCNF